MFKDAFVIFKKESKNLFKDRRTLFTVLIMPLVLMPAVFGVMGTGQQRQQRRAEETVYSVMLVNVPNGRFAEVLGRNLLFVPAGDDSEGTISVVFPPGYAEGDRGTVELFYDSTSSSSSFAANRIAAAVRMYEDRIAESILEEHGLSMDDIRTLGVRWVDTAPETAQRAGILSMLLPYFILLYVFSGSLGVGLDTTAGEKERGSLASILVNQVSRTSIALGKTMYVVMAAVMNSIASFIGITGAFVFMGKAGVENFSADISLFTAGNLIGLLVTMVILGSLAASLIVLMGSFAKNVKEGTSYIMPVFILVILIGVASMQMDASKSLSLYFVPIVNGVFMLKSILAGQFSLLQLLVTVGVNGACVGLLLRVIAGMFNSERILDTI